MASNGGEAPSKLLPEWWLSFFWCFSKFLQMSGYLILFGILACKMLFGIERTSIPWEKRYWGLCPSTTIMGMNIHVYTSDMHLYAWYCCDMPWHHGLHKSQRTSKGTVAGDHPQHPRSKVNRPSFITCIHWYSPWFWFKELIEMDTYEKVRGLFTSLWLMGKACEMTCNQPR